MYWIRQLGERVFLFLIFFSGWKSKAVEKKQLTSSRSGQMKRERGNMSSESGERELLEQLYKKGNIEFSLRPVQDITWHDPSLKHIFFFGGDLLWTGYMRGKGGGKETFVLPTLPSNLTWGGFFLFFLFLFIISLLFLLFYSQKKEKWRAIQLIFRVFLILSISLCWLILLEESGASKKLNRFFRCNWK